MLLAVISRTYHVLRGRVDVVTNAPHERAIDNVHRQADLRAKKVAASPETGMVSIGEQQTRNSRRVG